MSKQIIKISVLSALAVGIGLTGAFLTRGQNIQPEEISGVTSTGQEVIAEAPEDTNAIKVGDVFGSSDETIFKDNAEGYLEAGGINGEGSHALLRDNGPSQTVYLTSSVTDLDKFVGMNVKVWGETFRGQTASWLMDVGRIEVLATQGVKPK
jgi:hypothetical protein